jgi:FkbM family methyltransferase
VYAFVDWIYNRLKPKGLQKIHTPSGTLVVDPDDEVIAKRYILGDQHEGKEKAFVAQLLQPGDVFIDVGANIGDYTLLGAKTVGKEGWVYCFEPGKRIFECLQAMIKENGLSNVKAFPMGLGRRRETLTLYLDKANFGNNSFSREAAIALGGTVRDSYDVEIDTLDAIWSQYGAKGRKPRLLKIDVQGAEAEVLAGATGIMDDLFCDVLFELQPSSLVAFGCDPRTLLGEIARKGRTLFRLDGSIPVKEPLEQILSYAERHGYVDVYASAR